MRNFLPVAEDPVATGKIRDHEQRTLLPDLGVAPGSLFASELRAAVFVAPEDAWVFGELRHQHAGKHPLNR